LAANFLFHAIKACETLVDTYITHEMNIVFRNQMTFTVSLD